MAGVRVISGHTSPNWSAPSPFASVGAASYRRASGSSDYLATPPVALTKPEELALPIRASGPLVAKLAGHEARLRALTEQVVPGWYAGACSRCGYATHVVPGLTWITCTVCGTSSAARDHLEAILDEARDWIARPMPLAAALVALLDTEQSTARLHKRISKWGERGRIHAYRRYDPDGDPVGAKRYRLGDILDRLHAEGATRTTEPQQQFVHGDHEQTRHG